MKDKSYTICDKIRVTDVSDYMDLNRRMDISKFKQFEKNWYEKGYPEQYVRDRVARSFNWAVCASNSDTKTKMFYYKIMINAQDTENKSVDEAGVCAILGWKSFKFSKDGTMIIPTK